MAKADMTFREFMETVVKVLEFNGYEVDCSVMKEPYA